MLFEIGFLIAIYAIWLLCLVNSMISTEEVSLTTATVPFILTFPLAILLAAAVEPIIPGTLLIDLVLTAIVGVLYFVRWIMAIVSA